MTQETRTTQPSVAPAQDRAELTDAGLDQVAGGGGNGMEGLQPTGANRQGNRSTLGGQPARSRPALHWTHGWCRAPYQYWRQQGAGRPEHLWLRWWLRPPVTSSQSAGAAAGARAAAHFERLHRRVKACIALGSRRP